MSIDETLKLFRKKNKKKQPPSIQEMLKERNMKMKNKESTTLDKAIATPLPTSPTDLKNPKYVQNLLLSKALGDVTSEKKTDLNHIQKYVKEDLQRLKPSFQNLKEVLGDANARKFISNEFNITESELLQIFNSL